MLRINFSYDEPFLTKSLKFNLNLMYTVQTKIK